MHEKTEQAIAKKIRDAMPSILEKVKDLCVEEAAQGYFECSVYSHGLMDLLRGTSIPMGEEGDWWVDGRIAPVLIQRCKELGLTVFARPVHLFPRVGCQNSFLLLLHFQRRHEA